MKKILPLVTILFFNSASFSGSLCISYFSKHERGGKAIGKEWVWRWGKTTAPEAREELQEKVMEKEWGWSFSFPKKWWKVEEALEDAIAKDAAAANKAIAEAQIKYKETRTRRGTDEILNEVLEMGSTVKQIGAIIGTVGKTEPTQAAEMQLDIVRGIDAIEVKENLDMALTKAIVTQMRYEAAKTHKHNNVNEAELYAHAARSTLTDIVVKIKKMKEKAGSPASTNSIRGVLKDINKAFKVQAPLEQAITTGVAAVKEENQFIDAQAWRNEKIDELDKVNASEEFNEQAKQEAEGELEIAEQDVVDAQEAARAATVDAKLAAEAIAKTPEAKAALEAAIEAQIEYDRAAAEYNKRKERLNKRGRINRQAEIAEAKAAVKATRAELFKAVMRIKEEVVVD